MFDMNKLVDKLEAKATQVDRLEQVFTRLTLSKVLDLNKSERISSNIVVLLSKLEELETKQKDAQGKQGKELNEAGKNILQSALDFLFKHEKDLVYGIIADIFDIEPEEAAYVPISCIYECIIKDKVMQVFFPRLGILDARTRLSGSQSQNHSQLPHIPLTSKHEPKGKSLTEKTNSSN